MTDDSDIVEQSVVDRIWHSAEGKRYEFSEEATDWEKEAVREYGVESFEDVPDALEWRAAIDEMDNEQQARVFRGKHPTKDKDIPRPNPRRGPPSQ